MKHCKPIIGIAGGIGSGKSFISGIFRELGCGVIDSDQQARAALEMPEVRQKIREAFGDAVFGADGAIHRKALAAEIFANPQKRKILEAITHPVIAEQRNRETTLMLADPAIKGVIWDAPLLFEAGLNHDCDAVVFVDTPVEKRLERVKLRGWTAEELQKREKSQLSLDKKRELADHIVNNGGDAETSRHRVQQIFSQIIVLSRT